MYHPTAVAPAQSCIMYCQLLNALEAKLVVERDSASALRDEVDMLRKQTQSQAVLKTTIKYLVDFKTKQAETDQIVKVLKEKRKLNSYLVNHR